jgi:hypothetical protein
MTVAIGIKALNEEANIAACLESALAGVRPFAGHVVLADSGSHDRGGHRPRLSRCARGAIGQSGATLLRGGAIGLSGAGEAEFSICSTGI